MSAERRNETGGNSCIHPFIDYAQRTFAAGGALSEVLDFIPVYQSKVEEKVRDISYNARIPHAIALSSVGLGIIAVIEYVRSKGIALPDSREIVAPVVALAGMTPLAKGEKKDPESTWVKDITTYSKARQILDNALEEVFEVNPGEAENFLEKMDLYSELHPEEMPPNLDDLFHDK